MMDVSSAPAWISRIVLLFCSCHICVAMEIAPIVAVGIFSVAVISVARESKTLFPPCQLIRRNSIGMFQFFRLLAISCNIAPNVLVHKEIVPIPLCSQEEENGMAGKSKASL